MNLGKRPGRVPEFLAGIAFLLLFNLLFFRRVLFMGEVIDGGDQNFLHYVWKSFLLDSLRDGVFPFWNPFPFCGTPFFHDIQTGFLYPPDWLYFALPLPWGFGVSYFLHALAAGGFFYALAGKFLENPRAKILASLVYMASGAVTSRLFLGNAVVIQSYAWAPLFLLLAIGLYESPSSRRVGAFALVGTVFILAGHPQFPFLTIQLLAAYLGYRLFLDFKDPVSRNRGLRGIASIGIGGALSLGIGSIQIGPFLELAGHSATRAGGASYGFAAEGSMPFSHLPTLALPLFYGDPTRETFWESPIPYPEICGYIGLTGLLFIGAWLFLPKERKTSFWFWVCVASLLLALGEFTPLHRLFYEAVPGWDKFRQPGRTLFLFTLAGSLLAGFGFQALLGSDFVRDRKRMNRLAVTNGLLFLLLLVGTVAIGVSRDPILEGFAARENRIASEKTGSPLPTYVPGNFAHRHDSMVSALAFGTLSVGLFGFWLFLNARFGSGRTAIAWLAILLVAADLFGFGSRFLRTRPEEEWRDLRYPPSQVFSKFGKDIEGSRILVPDTGLDYRTLNRHPELYPNAPGRYGIRTVRGYSATILRSYSEFINLVQDKPKEELPGGLLILDRLDEMDPLALRVMGVRNVLDFRPHSPSFRPLEKLRSGLQVFEVPDALPRVFRAGESENRWGLEPTDRDDDRTEILEVSANRIVARTEGGEGERLVFSDCFFPGWKVWVDGAETPVELAFHTFQSVPVPSRPAEVVWEFKPTFWEGYLLLSLACLLAALLLAAWPIRAFRLNTGARNADNE